MPGLGESIASRQRHLETYDRVLRKVDVALWILDANDRAIENVQNLLSIELRNIDPNLVDRMVFALNKVDLVYPGETAWYAPANLPGEEQERNIVARLDDVRAKILQAVPTWHGEMLGYSAAKRYGLPQLFRLMIDAVSKKRQWVLASRKSLADFFDLVDPGLLPEEVRAARAKAEKGRSAPFQNEAATALRNLAPADFARIAGDKDALAAWLENFGVRGQNGEA